MAVAYRIRPVQLADVPALARLEPRCFTDPWSEAGFREMLGASYIFGLMAELKSGQLAGYLVARAIEQEGEILNLAVAPERRRHGLGAGLLAAGVAELLARGVQEVFLEVRASNEGAIAMYLGQGFRPMGRRREYYRKPVEDAMVLRKRVL